jgi:hypothetical protein
MSSSGGIINKVGSQKRFKDQGTRIKMSSSGGIINKE